ncbi:MAG: hypothetical protein WA188_05715 [Terriglobales bacterium]
MTNTESGLWQKVHSYAQEQFDYSVVAISGNADAGYTLKLSQLGSSFQPRQITVSPDEVPRILTDDELPIAVMRRIDEAIQPEGGPRGH